MKKHQFFRYLISGILLTPIAVHSQDSEQIPIDCELEPNQNLDECIDLNSGKVLDEVVVTGSYLKRDKFSSPSPVEVITFEDIEASGATTLGEYVRDLSFTVSSNTINNPGDIGGSLGLAGDGQNGARTAINIRGFGADGTITLVDGVRASSNIDVNTLVPDIALQQAEILLDGGGALYGSDAIAGVVNLIPTREYEGLKVRLFHNRDAQGDFGDSKFSFLAGTKFEVPWNQNGFNLVASFEARDRSTLEVLERPRYARAARSTSGLAQPGYFNEADRTVTFFGQTFVIPGDRIVDPDCGLRIPGLETDPGHAGYRSTGIPVNSGDIEIDPSIEAPDACEMAFDEWQDYLPSIESYVSRISFSTDVNDYVSLSYDIDLSNRETITRQSPIFALNGAAARFYYDHPAIVDHTNIDLEQNPFTNPNPYIAPSALGYRPFGKLGTRPSGYNSDGSRNDVTQTFTYNHTLKSEFTFGDSSWGGEFFANSSALNTSNTSYNISLSKYKSAAAGLGGPNCAFNPDSIVGLNSDDSADILTNSANSALSGVGDCEYFNPFLSAGLATLGFADPSLANSQELVDWLSVRDEYDSSRNENREWQAMVRGDVIDLPAGPLQLVLGTNFRQQEFAINTSRLTQRSDALTNTGFNFFFSETVRSIFAEIGIPILDNLDFSAAVRQEDYVDRPFDPITKPKYSISYRPIEDLALRLSYGESFTAPRGDELDDSSVRVSTTALARATDPFVEAGAAYIPEPDGVRLSSGNAALLPEETETVNIGFTYRGLEGWEFSMDVQEIKYFDRVVTLTTEELLGRQYQDFLSTGIDINDQAAVTQYLFENQSSEFGRDPITGQVTAVLSRPSNAEDIIDRFVDLKIQNTTDTDWGLFVTTLSATGYDEYIYVPEANVDGSTVDAIGQRNRDVSAARALPRWKTNLSLRWASGDHSLSLTNNFLSGVKFDGDEITDGAIPPEEIKKFYTTDLRYSYSFAEFWTGSMNMSVGANNIFGRKAQRLPVRQGLETRLHDPIGRTLYVDFTYDF